VIHRRVFIATVAVGVIATPAIASAQKIHKARRVGFLCVGSREQFAHLLLAFEERIAELGHVPGKDLSIEPRFANGQADLPRLANELVRLKIDLLLVHGNAVLAAAKAATTTVPIVTAGVIDPVGAGFIASEARPGRNITGVTSDVTTEIWGKRLELLKEAVPTVSRVALLWNPTDQARLPYVKTAEAGARKLGVTFLREEFRSANDFAAAFASMAAKRVGAVLIAGHPAALAARAEIVRLAAHHRVAAGYPWREAVEIGGLMSYGVNFRESYRRAADYVDKIFKGAKPADLPVEQPTKFELVINLKTAKALGLTIPPSLLARADQVIE
jgi:putative tryptophan/tyrosine transport system substrate-binding protein